LNEIFVAGRDTFVDVNVSVLRLKESQRREADVRPKENGRLWRYYRIIERHEVAQKSLIFSCRTINYVNPSRLIRERIGRRLPRQ